MSFVKLPLTPNGKVNWRHPHVERQLRGIWEEILAVAPVKNTDIVFELGEDSIDTIRVLNRIETTFGKRLHLAQIFHLPTIEQLARILDEPV